MEQNIEKLKYPIGKFVRPENIGKEQLEHWIKTIEEFPSKLNDEVKYLDNNELSKTYRPNGWTITQVVNHCADSHTNALIRFKLALTEDVPTIKPYAENLWAELPDSKNFPVGHSLKTLEGLHARWVYLLKNLTESELERHYFHPEKNGKISLKTTIGLYAWHCEHHLAHIINAKKR